MGHHNPKPGSYRPCDLCQCVRVSASRARGRLSRLRTSVPKLWCQRRSGTKLQQRSSSSALWVMHPCPVHAVGQDGRPMASLLAISGAALRRYEKQGSECLFAPTLWPPGLTTGLTPLCHKIGHRDSHLVLFMALGTTQVLEGVELSLSCHWSHLPTHLAKSYPFVGHHFCHSRVRFS